MTRIIKREMYCEKCKEKFLVPVVASTSSFALQHDPKLRAKYQKGELFTNPCPRCGAELVEVPKENQ